MANSKTTESWQTLEGQIGSQLAPYVNQIANQTFQGCQTVQHARKDEHDALKAEVAVLKDQLAKLNAALVEFLLRQK